MVDRKHIGESEPKAKVEPCARSFFEIGENESKTKFELNEKNFIEWRSCNE